MNFEVLHMLMKHCVECLILLLKQNDFTRRNIIKDPKMSIFSSDFQTIIKHLFPLYFFSIINEFEEEFSNTVFF